MKILKYLFFLILILVIGISIYIAIQPSSYRVSRTQVVKAHSPVVYNYVQDLKNWKNWIPWLEKDPDMAIKYGETTTGIGASYSWIGEKMNGKLETTAATPFTNLDQELTYEKRPPSEVSWTFEPEENATKVTWEISGDLDFMSKAYILYKGNMEQNIGPELERGLKKLDSVILEDIKKYSIEIDGITEHSGGFYLYTTTSSKISDSRKKIPERIRVIEKYITAHNITNVGTPFTYYHSRDEENNAMIFSNGVLTSARIITDPESDILTGQIAPFRALKLTLTGDTKNLKEAWDSAFAYLAERQIAQDSTGPYLEFYLSDASKTLNPAKWVTEIYVPVSELNIPPIVE
ncbi:SRPBCC family protein [Sinomicrobium weinanense]|uniref:SRPBCC family protein n=1 Tax=Sinomicrobium weinanense TaxID=2842200 RepID=A0A926Q3W7_9FLAO|nr:GyrI-like domain-containing protein [Sinomicrobium weinanense]MBC9796210.1 SRPBCC family protein [Sinomicrobium weinanense]MBU3123489.1 SRPBCC family protein [Sinomicrobium weinanense]